MLRNLGLEDMKEQILGFEKDVLSKKFFSIPLIIIVILGYGFSMFNRTIGVDDFLRDHYVGSGRIALSGRWGGVVWVKLLGCQDFTPFVDRFVAVLMLMVAAILFCFLLYSISKSKSIIPYTVAACFFVSYPLINEIWEYCGANFFVTGGLALSTLTLLVLRNNQHNIKWLAISGLLLLLPISSYESAIFYYMTIACVIVFYDNLQCEKYIKVKYLINDFVYYVIPIIIAFFCRIIVSFIICTLLDIDRVGGGATHIFWFSNPLMTIIKSMVGVNILKYVINALVYFPITIFTIVLVIFCAFFVVTSIKQKKGSVFIMGVLVIVSLFSQAILQAGELPYRTAQTIIPFVAFVFYILTVKVSNMKKKLRFSCYAFLLGLCWHQASYLNRVLGLNNLRSDNESYIIRSVGERITRDFDKKPVVFVSSYYVGPWIEKSLQVDTASFNGKIYSKIVSSLFSEEFTNMQKQKYIETNVNCATSQYPQLKMIFAYYGYNIDVVGPVERPHTPEYAHKDTRLLKEAMRKAKEIGMRPFEIYDNGEYLIVNLSDKVDYSAWADIKNL